MKALIDTSVLVASILITHADHKRALPVIEAVRKGQLTGVVATHALAECYSVITRMPRPYRLAPQQVWPIMQRDIVSLMTIHALTATDYCDLLEHLAQHSIAGGVVYDAVIGWVAMKTQVDQIITFNVKDFRRIIPALAAKVSIP